MYCTSIYLYYGIGVWQIETGFEPMIDRENGLSDWKAEMYEKWKVCEWRKSTLAEMPASWTCQTVVRAGPVSCGASPTGSESTFQGKLSSSSWQEFTKE